MNTKQERIKEINLLIGMIANRGRHLFKSKENGTMSYFALSENKEKGSRLWYFDKVGGKINPYPSNRHNDFGFSDGGTLWGLVHDFREYILTGKPSNGRNGYGGLLSDGWGYSKEDMDCIINKAKEIGFL